MNFAILFSSLAIFPYYSEPSWHQHCQIKKLQGKQLSKLVRWKYFLNIFSQKVSLDTKKRIITVKGDIYKQIKERGVIAQKSSMVLLENRA